MRREAAAGLVLAMSVGLAGCGLPEKVVGIHPPVAERTDVAPVDAEGAAAIAAEVLGEARAARTATGAAGAATRKAVLRGTALSFAEAAAATHTASAGTTPTLTKESVPTVLAVSRGSRWPRLMLVGSLDEATSTQYLDVLVSDSAATPYRLAASVPMEPGAKIPAIGDLAAGTPMVKADDASGMVAAPGAALAAYAAALAYPAPKAAASVGVDDRFATSLRTSATTQAKVLGKLAGYRQAHALVPDSVIAFRLADGGAVVFGGLTRTDAFTVASGAKEITLPTAYAALVGKRAVTKKATIRTLEAVVAVIPTSGKVVVVGADDQLASGSGS